MTDIETLLRAAMTRETAALDPPDGIVNAALRRATRVRHTQQAAVASVAVAAVGGAISVGTLWPAGDGNRGTGQVISTLDAAPTTSALSAAGKPSASESPSSESPATGATRYVGPAVLVSPKYLGPVKSIQEESAGIGYHLAPPPAGTNPGVSWKEAYTTCADRAATCPKGSAPRILLASATSMNGAQIQPDGTAEKTVNNRLIYVLYWVDQTCVAAGPPGPYPPEGGPVQPRTEICTAESIVDAHSGELIGSGSGGWTS